MSSSVGIIVPNHQAVKNHKKNHVVLTLWTIWKSVGISVPNHQPAFIDWDFPIKKPSICWVSPWLMFFWCRMVTGPQFPTTTLFQQMIWTTHFVESSSIMLGFPHFLLVYRRLIDTYIYTLTLGFLIPNCFFLISSGFLTHRLNGNIVRCSWYSNSIIHGPIG